MEDTSTAAKLSSSVATPRPILRWAGSKKQILHRLAAYWEPTYDTYYEPFCGSLSLFLHLRPRRARLSDLNNHLVNLYLTLIDDPGAVAYVIDSLAVSATAYYEVRQRARSEQDSVKKAAYFLYLNRLCFNGLYRTNKNGDFNVPFAGKKTPKMVSRKEVEHFAATIRNASIDCQDFETALQDAKQNDFVYLDPPYSVAATRVFREYMPSGFGHPDVGRLRRVMDRLDASGAHFVLSYAGTDEAKWLSRGYLREECAVHRLIGGASAGRPAATEFIISNKEPRRH